MTRETGLLAVLAVLAFAPGARADLMVEHDSLVATEVAGNGNGVLDPGEAFVLDERVISAEPETVTGVSGTLTAAAPEVSITSATSAWPDLAFGVATANSTPFAGSISAAAQCGANLPFSLALSAATGTAALPLAVPTGHAGADMPYDSTNVPVALPDGGTATSVVDVAAAGLVKHVRVRIVSLTHSYMGDLRLVLVAPDGTAVTLASNVGGGGQGFEGTIFDALAATSILAGSPPYSGEFRPVGDLTRFNGGPLAGTWTLRVTDSSFGDRGGLMAWGLDLAPAVCDAALPPPPPPPPPKGSPPPPGADNRSDNAKGVWPDPPGFLHASPSAHRPK